MYRQKVTKQGKLITIGDRSGTAIKLDPDLQADISQTGPGLVY